MTSSILAYSKNRPRLVLRRVRGVDRSVGTSDPRFDIGSIGIIFESLAHSRFTLWCYADLAEDLSTKLLDAYDRTGKTWDASDQPATLSAVESGYRGSAWTNLDFSQSKQPRRGILLIPIRGCNLSTTLVWLRSDQNEPLAVDPTTDTLPGPIEPKTSFDITEIVMVEISTAADCVNAVFKYEGGSTDLKIIIPTTILPALILLLLAAQGQVTFNYPPMKTLIKAEPVVLADGSPALRMALSGLPEVSVKCAVDVRRQLASALGTMIGAAEGGPGPVPS